MALTPAGPRFLNLRAKSLLRANLLAIIALALSFLLSDFPRNRATLTLILPLCLALLGTGDAVRCMRPRWDLYHASVVISLLMDVMVLTLILFLLLWPYFRWFL
jgi:hypothetical protein